MNRSLLPALVLTGLALAAAPAAAQQAHRQGWWAEASGGYGYLRVGTQADVVRRQNGTSWTARVGHQVGRNVSLGLEGAYYTGTTDTNTVYVGAVHAMVLFNPWGHLPLFLNGGVGIADGRVQVGIPTNQVFKAKGTGVGLSFGASYDIRVGERFAITPGISTHIAALGDFQFPAGKADDVIGTAYQIGVGITWR